jgi:methionyl-tRNA formyltransferase
MENLSIVFMGSPQFAVPILKALIQNYRVVGVVTQPDRPAGRGRKLSSPPIKTLALSENIPLIQPKNLREPKTFEQLKKWAPDVIIVTAYGQILRRNVLSLPKLGCINVHASLLPRWRGASPIQAAILHGDMETGITIMLMDAGLDTGPILTQRALPILQHDTASSLSERLSQLGADLLIETLPYFVEGKISPMLQDDTKATYAPMLKKSDGKLDFNQSIDQIEREIRAYSPWPGTFTIWKEKILKIHKASIVKFNHHIEHNVPGSKTVYSGKPAITAIDGLLILDIIQPAGKKLMAGEDFLRGAQDWDVS